MGKLVRSQHGPATVCGLPLYTTGNFREGEAARNRESGDLPNLAQEALSEGERSYFLFAKKPHSPEKEVGLKIY